ncbi:hypothetical protein CMI44_01440 [Candidatus Pacearchaeota archaeon]|nr:hypothetical protein [Candidatus Pacearchaeota archaeon]|tara:strand:+ start:154 stop:423 length:270 start_codon:yes stop_codon:yes gene_type:complete
MKIENGNLKRKRLGFGGHAGGDFSVFHKKDAILIAGDLFWSEEDWEYDSKYLELCASSETQNRSRDYVRNRLKSSVVAPGHGPEFIQIY